MSKFTQIALRQRSVLRAYGHAQVMPNAPQQYNGMDPSSQQAHMASIARSLFESSELKASNGGHHGLMPSSQPEHSTGGSLFG